MEFDAKDEVGWWGGNAGGGGAEEEGRGVGIARSANGVAVGDAEIVGL